MKIYNNICPCKDCNDRSAECHAKCEKYVQWQNNSVTVENSNWVSVAKQSASQKAIHYKGRTK